MAPRALPGLGLSGFWALGEDNWKDANDINLRLLSALVQLRVISATTALPGSPVDGNIYIVPTGGGDANKIAIRDLGAWVYVVPPEGFLAWAQDTNKYLKFDGTAWVDLIGGGGASIIPLVIATKTASYTLVLGDVGAYIRMNVATANTLTVPTNAAEAIPIGTTIPFRQIGAGQTSVAGASGVTINQSETLKLRKQGSSGALIKVAANEWDLTGDVELAP